METAEFSSDNTARCNSTVRDLKKIRSERYALVAYAFLLMLLTAYVNMALFWRAWKKNTFYICICGEDC